MSKFGLSKLRSFETKQKELEDLFSQIESDYQTFKTSENYDFTTFKNDIKEYIEFSGKEPYSLNLIGGSLMNNFKFWEMMITMKLQAEKNIKKKREAFLQLINYVTMFEVDNKSEFKKFFKVQLEELFTDNMLLSLINVNRKPKMNSSVKHRDIMKNVHYILGYDQYFEMKIGELIILKSKMRHSAKTEYIIEDVEKSKVDEISEIKKENDSTNISSKEKKEGKIMRRGKLIQKGHVKRSICSEAEKKEKPSNKETRKEETRLTCGINKTKPPQEKKKNKKEVKYEEITYIDEEDMKELAPLTEKEMEAIFNEVKHGYERKDSYSLDITPSEYEKAIDISSSDDDIKGMPFP